MEPYKRALRILLFLSERKKEDPANKYQICRAAGMKELGSEPTLLETINQLESSGNLRVVWIDPKARGPKKSSRYYDLEPLGLANLVGAIDWEKDTDPELFGHLAEKYHDFLPKIFDLWPAFVEVGIRDLFIKRFKELCAPSRIEILGEEIPSPILSKHAFEQFLGPWWALDKVSRERWLKGISRIESIRPHLAEAIVMRVVGDIEDANKMLEQIASEPIVLLKLWELQVLEAKSGTFLDNLARYRNRLEEESRQEVNSSRPGQAP